MTDTATRPHRAPRGEGDKLKDDLLDAAERLLAERGSMEAVSIRAVAKAVGVTPPSIYLHFEDKDELFFEVCSRRFVEFGGALAGSIEGIDDPVEQVRALGRAYVRYGVEHPEHYRILFGQKVPLPARIEDPTDLPGMAAFGLLVEAVACGIEAGAFRDGDALTMAIGLWSTTHGFVTLLQFEDEFPDQLPLSGALEAVLDQALRGVLA